MVAIVGTREGLENVDLYTQDIKKNMTGIIQLHVSLSLSLQGLWCKDCQNQNVDQLHQKFVKY